MRSRSGEVAPKVPAAGPGQRSRTCVAPPGGTAAPRPSSGCRGHPDGLAAVPGRPRLLFFREEDPSGLGGAQGSARRCQTPAADAKSDPGGGPDRPLLGRARGPMPPFRTGRPRRGGEPALSREAQRGPRLVHAPREALGPGPRTVGFRSANSLFYNAFFSLGRIPWQGLRGPAGDPHGSGSGCAAALRPPPPAPRRAPRGSPATPAPPRDQSVRALLHPTPRTSLPAAGTAPPPTTLASPRTAS